MTILVVTTSDDAHAPARVMRALARRGATCVRLDSDRYPDLVTVRSTISAHDVTRALTTPEGTFDLDEVTAVWSRRFNAGGALPASLGDLRGPAVEEARRSLRGLIESLPVPHMNALDAMTRCDHKEHQLVRARALGLDVPRTLFSNDPDAVRAFAATCGPLVTKAQSSWIVERGDAQLVVHTSLVDDRALEDLSGLRLSPMTFQERLPKCADVRATVIGDRVLCAELATRPDDPVDWRVHGTARLGDWGRAALPRSVERALVRLVRELGLVYAACDFVRTADGRTVFLEANGGGEWVWLDDTPGLGIADAIADALVCTSA